MAEVETIYRARVHYEADADASTAIEARAFELGDQANVDIDAFVGCAACSPYITAESFERTVVTNWADNLEQFITRLNGASLQV